MNLNLVAYHQQRALPVPSAGEPQAIRRIFDNTQLVERFDKWLLICGKAANTRSVYTFAVRQFAKYLMDRPLTAATKEDIRAYIAEMYGKGIAPSTMATRLDALRVFYDFLQLGGQVRVSVARLVQRRKLPKHLPHVMSEDQIEQIIAAARNPRELAILELFYASGLRVSELAHLRCEDLNLKGRAVIVRRGKGGDDRIALFGRKAAAALKAYLGERQSGPVFRQLDSYLNPEQDGGVQLQQGSYWVGFWRESRTLPDGSVKRVLRGRTLGMNRERMRPGRKLNDTISLAAELRGRDYKWREIFRIISPDAEMSSRERNALRNAVYHRLNGSKRKPFEPTKQIATRGRAREELKEFLDAREAEGVRVSRAANPERPITTRQLFRMVVQCAKRAGLSGIHPHTFRHSMATHCVNHGMDVRYVQELLGHASLFTTQKYLHLSPINLIRVHEKYFPR